MTAADLISPLPAIGLRRPLALAIALRELRAGASGLTIFVLCIALGVTAVAAISSLGASFDAALARQGRLLVGGDISFERVHRRASAEERAVLDSEGLVSESASLRAMARIAGGKSALVEVKAIDNAYPLYGAVVITEPKDAGPIWRKPGLIVVERSLLERLNVKIGSTLTIGEATVTIGGILGIQPDRLADRLAYGPRVLMSLETLDRTGLIQPGSLIRWIYRAKLPGLLGNDKTALNTARFGIESKFPESGFAITDWTDPAPSIRREVQRFTQFVSLVGLAALLLGGIGVGNAIGSYMAKKRDVIATFKCLGASGRLVLAVYLIQALMLAGLGIVLGIVLGALTPALLSAIYGDALPIALAVEPHPASLFSAAGAGLLTMLLFVLLPLGRASVVPPAVLMRSHLTDEQERPPLVFIASAAASGLALFALAIAASEERVITASISAGIVAEFLLLLGFGWVLQLLAARFQRSKPAAWALALASIAGRGSIARQIAVSLGLGLGFLVAIALIDRSLMEEFKENLRADAPAYYFLDIDTKDLGAFRDTVEAVEPDAKLADAPMLRGRIVAVNGVPAEKVEAAPDSRWVLASDRGLTYADKVPEGSTIVQGSWWALDYNGPPLVSFDAEAGSGLGLKLGDTIMVNVLGRNVEARIANFRKIDWESLAINFVMVFSPNTLVNAPHRVLVTLENPKETDSARGANLVQALSDRFPLVTAIKVGDIVEAAKDLLQKVMTAIRMTAAVTLLIGVLVLVGAVAATQQRRKYQAVLYKTLGATRGRIVRAELLEFGLLGLAIAAFALATGTITAWALCKWTFEVKFVFSGLAAAKTVLLALALVLGVGAIATWRVLSAKAAPYLRGE
ncbi:MAG TPA: FtsX-like permease family protein [Methyloceanibacter sp.]|nr:FtsX-like permease family protein [Methyloceanibacter sp.]